MNEKSNSTAINVSFNMIAFYITETIELLHLTGMTVSVIQAYYLMRHLERLPYKRTFSVDLEEAQEIFSLFGIFSFGIFRLLAFRFSPSRSIYNYLLLANAILSMIQSLIQTIFILFGNKKRSTNGLEQKKKPGREQITYLILANLSLWLLHTITRTKYANILFKSTNFEQPILNSNSSVVAMPNDEQAIYMMLSEKGFHYNHNNNQSILKSYFNSIVDFNYSSGAAYNTYNRQRPEERLKQQQKQYSESSGNENAQAIKWIIINTITYPLLLYYHFHSSFCLSNMWQSCFT